MSRNKHRYLLFPEIYVCCGATHLRSYVVFSHTVNYEITNKYFLVSVNKFLKKITMTRVADSDSFVFKYFLSCCAATIAESGMVFR